MSFFVHSNGVIAPAGRRALLGQSARLLSGAAVALLAGRGSLAAETNDAAGQDVRILNTALGAELEAIAAYQLGAESKLLQPGVLDLALSFQGHHKEHADLLAKTVAKLGGKAVQAKARYNFPVEQLKSQNRALLASEKAWREERAHLIEKNEMARLKVEAMISRLKALEQDS